jgi:hypothetical protein
VHRLSTELASGLTLSVMHSGDRFSSGGFHLQDSFRRRRRRSRRTA